MSRLTKETARLHRQACDLVALDRPLTEDEKEFVLTNWHEAADASAKLEGAFFTPLDLAYTLRFHVHGDRVIDLCAGIGRLAWGCREKVIRDWERRPPRELVCVEKNPQFVAVGRKVLPEAEWITGDVLTVLEMDLGRFDTAIANPPFGRIASTGKGPRYRGRQFEYHVIDIAADLARHGAFIVPQASAPFRYSGQPCFQEVDNPEVARFEAQTGIRLESNLGIDTSFCNGQWRGASPVTEVVVCDFTQRAEPASPSPAVPSRSNPAPVRPRPPAAGGQLAFFEEDPAA